MQEYLVTLLGGLVTTLELTLFSLLLGIVLAALMTWVLELRLPVATQLVQLWVLLFTGTPLLIQIFLIYYGPGQFEWLKASPLWPLLKQPWFCAVLALGLNTAAYSTRLFKGALDAIPAGEVEACRALGFNGRQTLWMKVRHAARHLVPAYSNEVILVLKGSSRQYHHHHGHHGAGAGLERPDLRYPGCVRGGWWALSGDERIVNNWFSLV